MSVLKATTVWHTFINHETTRYASIDQIIPQHWIWCVGLFSGLIDLDLQVWEGRHGKWENERW